MQGWYDARFEREMGCTETELLRWLPGAVGSHALRVQGQEARVDIGTGHLVLRWSVLPPRRIALMQMPRLQASFQFDAVEESTRQVFMRHFDLYTQRGGG